jgi:hypothetical protein
MASSRRLQGLAVVLAALPVAGCPIYVPDTTVQTIASEPLGQPAMPQACGQTAATAFYGPVQPGVAVVLGQHREVGGDANWSDGMNAYVGQMATVSQQSGVDDMGCPGVRVDIDGGQWFWRVRDLALPAAPQPVPAASPQSIPTGCGASPASAYYGPVQVGTAVVLGRHSVVPGGDNWTDGMNAYVGQVAYVTEFAGTDEQGCPGVRVTIDGGQWFWRIRDMSLAAAPPEACGQASEAAYYGPVTIGSVLVLGRHRLVDGDDNWSPEMDAYVGRAATVTGFAGTDPQGCPGVRVDIDGGQWFWRVRDARVAQ